MSRGEPRGRILEAPTVPGQRGAQGYRPQYPELLTSLLGRSWPAYPATRLVTFALNRVSVRLSDRGCFLSATHLPLLGGGRVDSIPLHHNTLWSVRVDRSIRSALRTATR